MKRLDRDHDYGIRILYHRLTNPPPFRRRATPSGIWNPILSGLWSRLGLGMDSVKAPFTERK